MKHFSESLIWLDATSSDRIHHHWCFYLTVSITAAADWAFLGDIAVINLEKSLEQFFALMALESIKRHDIVLVVV
jgi:hypothetical protein